MIDGFDLDIENYVRAYNYIFPVKKLQDLFATDMSKKYYIFGTPQCPVPDASMGDVIFNAEFDYLFLQFYKTPTCSARGEINGFGATGGRYRYFSLDTWKKFVGLGFSRSNGMKLFIELLRVCVWRI